MELGGLTPGGTRKRKKVKEELPPSTWDEADATIEHLVRKLYAEDDALSFGEKVYREFCSISYEIPPWRKKGRRRAQPQEATEVQPEATNAEAATKPEAPGQPDELPYDLFAELLKEQMAAKPQAEETRPKEETKTEVQTPVEEVQKPVEQQTGGNPFHPANEVAAARAMELVGRQYVETFDEEPIDRFKEEPDKLPDELKAAKKADPIAAKKVPWNKFVPDPRNPYELQLRRFKDLKIARENKRRVKKALLQIAQILS